MKLKMRVKIDRGELGNMMRKKQHWNDMFMSGFELTVLYESIKIYE